MMDNSLGRFITTVSTFPNDTAYVESVLQPGIERDIFYWMQASIGHMSNELTSEAIPDMIKDADNDAGTLNLIMALAEYNESYPGDQFSQPANNATMKILDNDHLNRILIQPFCDAVVAKSNGVLTVKKGGTVRTLEVVRAQLQKI